MISKQHCQRQLILQFTLASALVALLTVGLVWKIVTVSWNEYSSTERMVEMRKNAFVLHLATCSIIAVSSLVAPFT